MDLHRRLLLVNAAGLSQSGLSACQRPEPLARVAGITWVGHAPLYLARERDFLKISSVRLMLSRMLDAIVSFESYVTQLAGLGATHLLDIRRFPGAIVDVLAARSAALADNHTLLGGAGAGLCPMAQSVSTLMLHSSLLKTSHSLDGINDVRFLPAA